MITVTEILGTDSLSGSRIVINDNFNILSSEINSIESYFNPTAGTINNLNDLKTESLRVGINTVLLDVNASKFDILADINSTGDLTLNGSSLYRNNINPTILNTIGGTTTFELGTSSAPTTYTVERVGNNSGTALSIQVHEGNIGQELFIIYAESTTGDVEITGAVNPLILTGGATTITMSSQGSSVHLLSIDDGTGNGDWYLVGGSGYTLS